MPKTAVILAAAGRSSRFKDKHYKKAFAPLAEGKKGAHLAVCNWHGIFASVVRISSICGSNSAICTRQGCLGNGIVNETRPTVQHRAREEKEILGWLAAQLDKTEQYMEHRESK